MKLNILFPLLDDFFGIAINPWLHFSLLVMSFDVCGFFSPLASRLLRQQIDIFSTKHSITSAVGCSIYMTRVLEFESIISARFLSQKKLWSICAGICHCRMHTRKKKPKRRKTCTAFCHPHAVQHRKRMLFKWMNENGLDNDDNLLNKRANVNKICTEQLKGICRVHLSRVCFYKIRSREKVALTLIIIIMNIIIWMGNRQCCWICFFLSLHVLQYGSASRICVLWAIIYTYATRIQQFWYLFICECASVYYSMEKRLSTQCDTNTLALFDLSTDPSTGCTSVQNHRVCF